ncbi:EAL domain-containing protein [Pseudidiomarina insulisalsae]|uniref:Diguanylate phosphodiesterase n=1 Tax=Pseudidiomarina insulisalsae TaxID=575789 RepID=A0A432YQ91_9GAMM|nr:EAL domain-containing protein [Pseudidiomarina insulisalsae]RUO63151.1 diguanylate phosphodiesterase [Pseudidiomarina insulisalsae]
MTIPEHIRQQTCKDCLEGKDLGFQIEMAFQPIVDMQIQKICAYEALVRGPNGEGAGWVFERVTHDNRYYFDQACRVKAIETAASLGCNNFLHINFLPNAVYNPDTCIRATIEAADHYEFDLTKLVFEVTEGEEIISKSHLQRIFSSYAARGFRTAIDDYGAGYASHRWLVELRPHILKLDRTLVSDIDKHPEKQEQVKEIWSQCELQGTQLLAEGVETLAEVETLLELKVRFMQGYYFAKPAFRSLPDIVELAQDLKVS